ncbi:MAG: glycosyltransferase family 4 protein [Chloroflexi bacterium]|nr:glycosyltransferase family 4 protein [Chloroflexota bacterium]MCC6895912.1 glycosyltransferase family 4 protein [Anaerolineae bacterium]
MTTCLVNLAYLDPAHIGGVGRIAQEVSRLLAECADTRTMRVTFVVGWRFAGAFAEWMGASAVVVPYLTRYDFALTVRLLKPDVVVSSLFGLEPFQQVQARHVAGMPDALVLDHPELFNAADLAYRQQVYANLSRAFRVVTLSEHARGRLLHHTALKPEQVVVAALGADPRTQTTSAALTDLPSRYLLYPANYWPHKRHDLLLRIMNRVWEQQPDLHLILTGGRSEADQQTLRELIARNGCPPERIHDLGYVTDAQLTALYREAEAVLFTSQYEGFGMPLLEAMRQGCPVICAPVASMPEIVGEAGIYVSGEDIDAWANAVLKTLPEQRERLVVLGVQQAAKYTWANTRARWHSILAEAGVDCAEGTPNAQVAAIAARNQTLLERMSKIASGIGRNRLRQILWMPLLLALQARLLWQARTYSRTR